MSRRVQNTHIDDQVRALHAAILDIATVVNRPQGDADLIREAGIPLDRALFPLLVGIGRLGPVGIVELADRIGRDYTTVSRQVGKLEELGLVSRRAGEGDRRVREAVVTAKGRAMTERVDAARLRLGRAILKDWEPAEIDTLLRLMRRFADALVSGPAG